MKQLLSQTLIYASLTVCALSLGCASMPGSRNRALREQRAISQPAYPTTATGSPVNRPAATPLAVPLAVPGATLGPRSTSPTETRTQSTQAHASPAVVQLAPFTAVSFDSDLPTVGSFATVQTRYKDPEAQVSMAPSAPSSPELNVVEEPVTPPLEAEQGVVNHLNHNADLMGSYLIETGDSLEIKFRETPELDNVVTVRPDGLISLQIVGDVPAAGLTPELMRQALVSAYSAELTKPDIAVIVRSFSGNSIYVGGEVFAPGRVPLTGRVTTLNAIILAGGFKDTADQQRVVVRHGDGTCCEYDLKSVLKCEGKGQDIQLRPYDVVYVPKSKIAKVNLFVEQYIDKVIPFSRNFGVFISRNTGLTSAVASP